MLKIEVAESVDQLKEMLEKQRYDTQRSKVQVLWWLKTGQAQQVNQLTHLSGYHRTTIESRVGLLSVQLVNSLAWESNPSVSYSGSFSTVGSTG